MTSIIFVYFKFDSDVSRSCDMNQNILHKHLFEFRSSKLEKVEFGIGKFKGNLVIQNHAEKEDLRLKTKI